MALYVAATPIGNLSDASPHLRETITNLEGENEYLMEQAINAAADSAGGRGFIDLLVKT